MQTRIGHVQVRYRVPAGASAASSALSTLDHIARERIGEACERAFNNIFEDDSTVYVVRSVTSRVAVLSKRQTSEAQLADQWGSNLCAAVVRTIVGGENEHNLIRFENQAEFVSRFLVRLATGDAWDHWYYGAFRSYRRLLPEDAVISVLEDNHEFVCEILKRLRKANALELVLRLLGSAGQRRLWNEVVRSTPRDDQLNDAFRIFVQSGFQVIDVLELWSVARPLESVVLDSYLRAKPWSPDWTSGRSLAEAVVALIRFMAAQGMVRVSSPPGDDHVSKLEQTLTASFDWLDTRHLLHSVLAIFHNPELANAEKNFTLRPSGATPNQKRILDDLLQLLRSKQCQIEIGYSNSQGNLLRLLAVLPDQADATSAAAIIKLLESIVKSSVVIGRSNSPRDVLRQLRRGELAPEYLFAVSSEMMTHLKVVVSAGESAVAIVEELVKQSIALTEPDAVFTESDCAGLFLLVRAVQDLRLSSILKDCDFESMHPLLAGLAIRICGQSAWLNDSFDPGAAIWSGIEPGNSVECLKQLESLDRDRFAAVLLDLVAAQRLVETSRELESVPEIIACPCSAETMAMLDSLCKWLVRTWARWLPGLNQSSFDYLLDNFIRRPGRIEVGQHNITVHLASGALDAILRMAGYLDETPEATWLGNRTVRFQIGS